MMPTIDELFCVYDEDVDMVYDVSVCRKLICVDVCRKLVFVGLCWILDVEVEVKEVSWFEDYKFQR